MALADLGEVPPSGWEEEEEEEVEGIPEGGREGRLERVDRGGGGGGEAERERRRESAWEIVWEKILYVCCELTHDGFKREGEGEE